MYRREKYAIPRLGHSRKAWGIKHRRLTVRHAPGTINSHGWCVQDEGKRSRPEGIKSDMGPGSLERWTRGDSLRHARYEITPQGHVSSARPPSTVMLFSSMRVESEVMANT